MVKKQSVGNIRDFLFLFNFDFLQVCCSTDHLAVVRRFSPRPLQMSARLTLSPSRALSCWPCGLESPRPTCEMCSTKRDKQLHVCCSLTNWTVLLNREAEAWGMEEEPVTGSLTRSWPRWTEWARRRMCSSSEPPTGIRDAKNWLFQLWKKIGIRY